MKTKTRMALPVILVLILAACLSWGGWLAYDSLVDRSGWVEKDDGSRFYRDFHAKPVSGWLELPEGQYFLDETGVPKTSWQKIGIHTYYFDSDGRMAVGWKKIDGADRYFDEGGCLVTGWLTQGDETWYLQSDGTPAVGWLELEGERYYLPEGKLATGWQTIDESRRYFDGDGVMAVGFRQLDEGWFYFDSDGAVTTGETTIENERYLFGENGVMCTGWVEGETGRRYYSAEGPMARGWCEIDGDRYYFSDDGKLYTGWLEEGEYRYYLTADGPAAVGPVSVDGRIHCFSPKGIEVILVNGRNPVPAGYSPDLVNITSDRLVDQRCYSALRKMLDDCNAAGIQYDLNSAYRTQEEQELILESRTQSYMELYELSYEEAQEKALETVAVPGTSEHQLGLAVDLLGKEAIPWFQEHCWDYGFIRRYYGEKADYTGIADEPWHFRYVGTLVSLDMKDSGLCLEEYLGAKPVK